MTRNHSDMVIVVGTSHSIQMATDEGNAETREEFMAFLESLCRTHEVRAVAEEMNAEALAERGCSTSIPMRLAQSLGVNHRFCDPDRSERARLGMFQENDVRAQGFLSTWSEAEISSRILAEHIKRERYWLDQIRGLNQWPLLFVCGANHVASFCDLLAREGLAASIGAADWSSNNTVEGDARKSGARLSL